MHFLDTRHGFTRTLSTEQWTAKNSYWGILVTSDLLYALWTPCHVTSYSVFLENYVEWRIIVSIIFDPNYPFHFPYTLYFLIYNVLSQYTILLQIPLHYITVSNGLWAYHLLILITHVAHWSSILNFVRYFFPTKKVSQYFYIL